MNLKAKLFLSLACSTQAGLSFAAVLEEVTVVAQKREQSVQDVGIAVTAMTGDQLEALGFDNAQQVTAMAPGVQTVQPNGEANYSVGIRGVTNSDFTTNVESPVAIYVDEVYISQMSGAGFSLFDVERVEILRGPQGTLFGRNATGGLVHFLTVKPDFEFDAYSKFTLGRFEQTKLEGAIGGGITDKLAARFSFNANQGDGYIENRFTGDDLNNSDDQSARLQLLYNYSDNLDFLLNLRVAEQDIDTGFFENVSSIRTGELTPNELNPVLNYIDNDGDVYAGDYDDPGFNQLDTKGATLTANWQINDSLKLVSITDTSSVERTYIEDSDASPVSLFNFFLTTDAEQFSQELRLEGEQEKFRWTAGAYFLELDINDSNGAISDPFIGGGGTTVAGSEGGLFNPYSSELSSQSIFGQLEIPLSDRFNLVAGLRVIEDEKDFSYSVNAVEFLNPESQPGFAANANRAQQAVLGEYVSDRKDTEVSGRLQLDWFVNATSLAYASWNRGVKGGGYNAPIFPLSPPNDYDDETLSYDPEQLDAYEIGFKTDIGTIGRLNLAAYYYDYKDYQIFNIIGLDTFTVNSPDAQAQGFEAELQLSPGSRWDILFGAAYNDAEAELLDGTKQTPIQSPDLNVNGLIRYELPTRFGSFAFQGDFVYRDDVIFALTGDETVQQDAYTTTNASLSYESPDSRWQVVASVENLTNREYVVQAFDLSGVDVFGITEQYFGRPRWWSLSAKYTW
ncbi:TonB-dependent receptor [Sessilibacter corallicola]|uniref:TonB-dependent receptor n=1 Tax=Sessilibacter corallicola TaxID=2904075 RepID=A0ABQ0A4Q6_9GAMM